jgi:hypothetical protein
VNCDENIPPEAELELFAVVGAVLELCVEGDCSAGGQESRLNEPEQEVILTRNFLPRQI